MNKKTCNIILDLLPEYIENDVTADTRELVEEHIKDCNNCQSILKSMKVNIVKEENKLRNDSKIEIEKIKKVNRNIKKHKIILIASSIIIFVITIILVGCVAYNKLNKTLYDEIQEVYSENIKLDNYHMTYKEVYTNQFETGSFEMINDSYYKEGKYKVCEYFKPKDLEATETVKYGELDSDISNRNIPEQVGYYESLNYFKNVNYENVEIRTFDEREWYVYKLGEETDYCEYWIDKDNLTDIRYIANHEKFYRESLYILEKNTVTDEDIEKKEEGTITIVSFTRKILDYFLIV